MTPFRLIAAVAADGAIWFSDASQRFDQHHGTV